MGQVLTKTESGEAWQDAPDGLPEGGETGQVLTKTSTGAQWDDIPSDLPAGGTDGQILTKTADGVAWEDAPEAGVTSFNGRTGAVTPQEGDYTADMVGARPSTWTPTASDVGAIPDPSGGTTGQILEKTETGTQWADNPGMTQAAADARYLQLSGGTMTGALTLNGNPSADNQAANKAYVDSKAPKYVSVTLSASGWAGNSQTVTVQGVVADETAQLIQPMPAIASQAAYMAAGIYCSGQAANSLTFTCQTAPTENITVYVVMQEVSAA